jgi:hypothetical protein
VMELLDVGRHVWQIVRQAVEPILGSGTDTAATEQK